MWRSYLNSRLWRVSYHLVLLAGAGGGFLALAFLELVVRPAVQPANFVLPGAMNLYLTLRGAVVVMVTLLCVWWSARKHTQVLAAADGRFEALAGAMTDGVLGSTVTGRIIYANRAAFRIFGRDDLVGQNVECIIPPRLHQAHHSGIIRFMATGRSRLLDRPTPLPALRADGEEFPAEVTLTVCQMPGQTIFWAVVRDLSLERWIMPHEEPPPPALTGDPP